MEKYPRITVRLSAQMIREAERCAGRAGMSISEWIKQLVSQATGTPVIDMRRNNSK